MTVRIDVFRSVVGAALAAGALLPTSVVVAGNSAAVPCYSADCVPNVARNVVAGGPCVPQPRRAFAYGLEPDGGTVICNAAGVWEATGPLVGVYNVAMPCPALNLSAQGSDGIALQCLETGVTRLRWAHRPDM
ncbi:hypothetical protein A5662_08940 [Mycobacteriaceae bacterium 1482268.1]|nr:hypothetical protein A5662_08940 [Mycobacteriaceae bacterium 1482268.1]